MTICGRTSIPCLSSPDFRSYVVKQRMGAHAMARNNAASHAQKVASTFSPLLAPSSSSCSANMALDQCAPMQQLHDDLLVVHLRDDLLTLISGHRRGVRQLQAIELRPPIPLMLSSPTSKKRSHCVQRQDIPTSSNFSLPRQ